MAKNNTLKKVLAFIGLGITILGLTIGGFKLANKGKTTNLVDEPGIVEVLEPPASQDSGKNDNIVNFETQLASPTGLTFNESEGKLTWNDVAFCSSYTVVTSDGNEYVCDGNSFDYQVAQDVADGEKISFEVRANGTGEYKDSEKAIIEHTVSMQETKLCENIYQNLLSGLENIVSNIKYANVSVNKINCVNYSNNAFYINANGGYNDKQDVNLEFSINLSEICEFNQADDYQQLSKASEYLSFAKSSQISLGVNFYKTSYLDKVLNSPTNDSQIAQLQKEGYDISYLYGGDFIGSASVSSQGVVKCQKDDDIKYIRIGLTSIIKNFYVGKITLDDALQSESKYITFSELIYQELLPSNMKYSEFLSKQEGVSIESRLNLPTYEQQTGFSR